MGKEFDFENALLTGNLAVDSVMSCIAFYRKKQRAIDTIWLCDDYYTLFFLWAKKNDPSIDETIELFFDGVAIKKQLFESTDYLYPTFFKSHDDIAKITNV